MVEPSSDIESRILELAKLRGILSASDLECPPEDISELGSLSWGPRITALIRKGRLDHKTVQAIALELMQSPMFAEATWHREDERTEAPQETFHSSSGYTDLQPIAMGGGGMVYKAKDSRLDRWVALKFPRDDQPQRLTWMLREARAQAKVDHPHVVKVHEVGEHEGQPFIAMQLVQGGTLRDVHQRLRLEQKVLLIVQIADALHAAHSQGLLHQDIKPANILVEFKDDGTPWPLITDFGLVRQEAYEIGRPSSIGSPPYSSPEQMEGHIERLDRRSDVFSLGATLYFALVGVPPFDSTDPKVLINAVPIPLRARDAQMPEDLEAIADKCLKRDRSERYASARAVAEDLRRFLDGRPVEACHPTLRYRATKFVHRHQPQVIVGFVATLLLLCLGFISIRSARRASFRHQLAVKYEQEIRTVEHTLRLAHLSRLHDRRRSVGKVRQTMEQIQSDMTQLGSEAVGPGSYALGQGYFILDDIETALQHLDRAWTAQFHTPECAFARAQVLIELLNRKKSQISTNDSELRKQLQKQLETKYGDPAIACLRMARSLNTPYMEALESYLNGNSAQALKRAEEAALETPWMYEARRLQSKVYRELAQEAIYSGQSEEARKHFEKAIHYLDQAIEQGQSNPANWVDKANTIYAYSGIPGMPREEAQVWLQKAMDPFNTAITIDPDYPSAYGGLSVAYVQRAQYTIDQGKDPMPDYDQAVKFGELERQKTPASQVTTSLFLALMWRGQLKVSLEIDPRPDLDRAIAGYRQAYNPKEPEIRVLRGLRDAMGIRGFASVHINEDPLPFFREAIQWSKEVLKLEPRDPKSLYRNLSFRDNLQSTENARNLPLSEPLDAFISDLITASKDPKMKAPFNAEVCKMLGYALRTRGTSTQEKGGNPEPDFEESRKYFEKAIALAPQYFEGYVGFCDWANTVSTWQKDKGRDPGPVLLKGLTAAKTARKLAPGIPSAWFMEYTFDLFIAYHRKQATAIAKAESNLHEFLQKHPSLKQQVQDVLQGRLEKYKAAK